MKCGVKYERVVNIDFRRRMSASEILFFLVHFLASASYAAFSMLCAWWAGLRFRTVFQGTMAQFVSFTWCGVEVRSEVRTSGDGSVCLLQTGAFHDILLLVENVCLVGLRLSAAFHFASRRYGSCRCRPEHLHRADVVALLASPMVLYCSRALFLAERWCAYGCTEFLLFAYTAVFLAWSTSVTSRLGVACTLSELHPWYVGYGYQ